MYWQQIGWAEPSQYERSLAAARRWELIEAIRARSQRGRRQEKARRARLGFAAN